LLRIADELVSLSDERHFVTWRSLGAVFRGWCLVESGQPKQGIQLMSDEVAEVRVNGKLHVPHVLTLIADAHRMAGEPNVALLYVAEAEQFAEATQVLWLQAETLRLRGDLTNASGDRPGAERHYHQAIMLA
jgi:hypothetical protein